MKKIIYTLIVLLSGFMYSQPSSTTIQLLQCSSYTPNSELNKFVGNWKWASGNDSFEMVLKKEKVFDLGKDDQSCEDIIIGFHKYIKNGTIIESTLQNQNSSYALRLNSISSWSIVINSTELRGGIKNISNYNNPIKFEFEYIDSNHLKIKSLKNFPGTKIYFPGQTIPSNEINLPQDIILTNQ